MISNMHITVATSRFVLLLVRLSYNIDNISDCHTGLRGGAGKRVNGEFQDDLRAFGTNADQ